MTEWVSDAALKLYKIIKFYYVLVTLAPLFWLTDSHLYLVTPVTIKLWLFKKTQAKKLKFDERCPGNFKKREKRRGMRMIKKWDFSYPLLRLKGQGIFQVESLSYYLENVLILSFWEKCYRQNYIHVSGGFPSNTWRKTLDIVTACCKSIYRLIVTCSYLDTFFRNKPKIYLKISLNDLTFTFKN